MKILTGMLTGIIIMVGSISITNAATKCVALNSLTSCSGGTAKGGSVDWGLDCYTIPITANMIHITGVGMCSSTSGTVGQTADSIATENLAGANKYCWCKMTSPVLSRYVFSREALSAEFCSYACASLCQGSVKDTEFLAAMLMGIK